MGQEIERRISEKGDEIRDLKAKGISKEDLAPHIVELKNLKAQLPGESEPPKEKKNQKSKTLPEKKKKHKKPEDMSEFELRRARLGKVQNMRDASVEPFEYSFKPTKTAMQLSNEYNGRLENGEEDEEADVSVAGRIMTRRVMGKLAFFT